MAINFESAADSVARRGIAHPGGARSAAKCNVVIDGKLVPMITEIPLPAITESKAVTEREPKINGVLPVTELDKLSKQARYKLANAEAIKAKDRERKSAKKALKAAE